MSATRPIMEKVAKLLALAEGKGTTPAEAATAAAAAQRLISQYRIEQAELDQTAEADPIESTATTKTDESVSGGASAAFFDEPKAWHIDLLNAIARANGCLALTNGRRRGRRWLDLVGRRSDLEVCRYLWDYLTREVERLKAQQTRGWSQARKGHFCLGAAHIIAKTLREEDDSMSSGTRASAALVQQSRYEAARAWCVAQHPNLRSRRARGAYVDREAYRSGQIAGAGVSLRKAVATTISNQARLLK